MMKKHMLLVLMLLAIVVPLRANDHCLNRKSIVLPDITLPNPHEKYICHGETDTLMVPEGFRETAYRYDWRDASDSVSLGDSTVFEIGPIDSNKVYILKIYNDSLNVLVAKKFYIVYTNPTYAHDESITACDSYTWATSGETYTRSCDTIYRGVTVAGCDSLITLHLTVDSSKRNDTTVTACDSLRWHGIDYYVSGNYLYVENGTGVCMDYTVLKLTVNRSTAVDTMAVVCDSINWRGQTLRNSGRYTHIMSGGNSMGCDSTTRLHLTVRESSMGIESLYACDSLLWIDGNTYTTGGSYTHHTFNSEGCDSTITLNLTVHPTIHRYDTQTVCDSYVWPRNGRYYTADNSSDWVYGGKDANQCDSMIHLDLVVNQSTTGDTTATVCNSIDWWGQNLTSSGSATHTFMMGNSKGCDSTLTLHLTVNQSTTSDTMAVVCNFINWWGQNLTVSGTATHTFLNGNSKNCDSTLTLHLTVRNSSSYTQNIQACDSLKWIDGNKYTSNNNTAQFIITNSVGCDSIISLNLSIYQSAHVNDQYTACDNFVWHRNNVFYTTSNHTDWVFGSPDSHGCDSVFHLQLTISISHHSDTTASVCDSILWRGQKYYSSGDYIYSYPGSGPCINDKTLHLTIRHAQHQSFDATACDSYFWNRSNTTYYASGTKTYSYFSPDNCISVDTLYLVINNSSYSSDDLQACDSLRWMDGITYTTSNNSAQYTINNYKGCDSIITLNLTIHNSSHSNQTENVCDQYRWPINGELYDRSGQYFFSTLDSYGCQHTNSLDLTIRHSSHEAIHQAVCESYEWVRGNNRRTFTESVVANLSYINDENCPSIDTLYLTVFGYPVPEVRKLIEKRHPGSSSPWMLIFPREDGEQEYYYQWYRNNEPVNGANKQFFQLPYEQPGDTVIYSVWVASGNMSVCSSFSYDTIHFVQNKVLNIITFPNPAIDGFNVSIQGEDFDATRLDVYSETGQLVISVPMQENRADVNQKIPSGIYMLQVVSRDGRSAVDKLIVK